MTSARPAGVAVSSRPVTKPCSLRHPAGGEMISGTRVDPWKKSPLAKLPWSNSWSPWSLVKITHVFQRSACSRMVPRITPIIESMWVVMAPNPRRFCWIHSRLPRTRS